MAGIDGTHHLNPGGWMSPPLIGLTLANNVIDGANCTAANGSLSMAGIQIRAATSQPMPTSPHQNIAVRGNFIADPAHSAIWIGNTTGGSVSGNYLLDPNDRGPNPYAYQPFSSYSLQPLVVETSQNIATGGNTIDQTSGRMFVTDTAYNELAAYAPKSVVRLNAYNLGKISDPAITLTDADGNTAALAIRNAADHFLDVQIPAGAELGGGFLTLAANSVKYFGTLFLDSVDNIPAVNGCTYEVSPSARPLSRLPGTVPVLVVTQAGCAYQAIASDSFATPGPAAKGTAVVSMAFAADAGSKRTALIEIAGRRFALRLPGSQGIRPAAARTQ